MLLHSTLHQAMPPNAESFTLTAPLWPRDKMPTVHAVAEWLSTLVKVQPQLGPTTCVRIINLHAVTSWLDISFSSSQKGLMVSTIICAITASRVMASWKHYKCAYFLLSHHMGGYLVYCMFVFCLHGYGFLSGGKR